MEPMSPRLHDQRRTAAMHARLARQNPVPPPRDGPAGGFTLVELLVVVAIMITLMVLAVPAARDITGGVRITGSAEDLIATFNNARQRASALNRTTAVRFWRADTGTGPFRSFQLYEQSDPGNATLTAADKEIRLPTGVIITENATFSPLLGLALGTDTTRNPARAYADVLFLPSGSITAPVAQAFLTLRPENASVTGGTVPGLPPNFATLQIEPFNGRPLLYRP